MGARCLPAGRWLNVSLAIPRVVIAGDNDAPGRKAAWDAGQRWHHEGRAVRVIFPDRPGEDWNDVLRARGVLHHGG